MEHQPLGGLTRDEVFWLEDGNIVLVGGNCAFKIYRGLLAAQSPVFAHMFATAHPDAAQLYDGFPIVRLSDSPEDLRHLLRALVPKAYISVYSPLDEMSYTFNQLSSLARLGHKYQIEDVQRQAIACLKLFYADVFDTWVATDTPFDVSRGADIGAVRLARLTDNPSMLPVALYLCSLLGGALAHGWTREDCTVEMLEADDLERCINGYGVLREETPGVLSRIFEPSENPRCATSVTCTQCLIHFHQSARAHSQRHYLLHRWESDVYDEWIDARNVGPCATCMQALNEREHRERRAIWGRLPAIYGLQTPEGWET